MGRDSRDLERRAAELVITTQFGAAGLLERRLRIGHDRAAALLQLLEERGVVGPSHGPGRARDVLVVPRQLRDVLAADFPTGDD